MLEQLLTSAIYLAIAGFVTALNWHRPTRLSGVCLIFYSAISTLTFFMQQAGWLNFEWMVLREVSLATLMTVTSLTLIQEGEPIVPHRIVMIASLLITGLCSVISIRGDIDLTARLIFAYGANAGFLTMAVAIAVPGGFDRVRGWISAIDNLRRSDSPTPDFDYLIKKIDGQ